MKLFNKKGMEMWELIAIIIALFLFFFVIIWYGGLGKVIGQWLDKFTNLL